MFEDLDNVRWSNLKQAHGKATHVPEAIRGLISNDPKIQETSYWKLDNYVVLQSDLYEAAYFVIPFLIEIIQSKIQVNKKYIYDLLFEIANGSAPEAFLCTHKGIEMPLADACRSAIGAHVDLYLEEVGNSESLFRSHALELLISMYEYKKDIIPYLIDLLVDEKNDEFKDTLNNGISELNYYTNI